MKTPTFMKMRHQDTALRAMTLIEVLVAVAIGSVVLSIVAVLTVFGARSFVALGNYSALDQQSRQSIDQMTREIRQATAVLDCKTNATACWLSVTNSTASPAYSVTYLWTAASQQLVSTKIPSGESSVLLTRCTNWTINLYQRTPIPNQTNAFFDTTGDKSQCKLVNMTWKCSRVVGGTKLLNTETILTAQIVLRNQQSN
jgi:prepilin-type N-terminal cleavage/methylation domain-containing protein